MVKIVQKEDPVLRKETKEVPINEIESKKIQKIIEDMKVALESQEDGVAIAAPQIGIPLKIFIVSGRVFSIMRDEEHQKGKYPDTVFINPKILKISKEKEMMEEGCLSVRYLYGKVKRSNKVTVEAYDEKGELFKKGASGLMAQIFQHETDHLNGILFTDKAIDVEDIPPKDKETK